MSTNQLENPLRIKITGNCNRNCFFCHREGGMDIEDIKFSRKWKTVIEEISAVFGIRTIAVTGGEPFCYDNILSLYNDFSHCKGITQLSMTTNGTIEKDENFWIEAKNAGLYKVNISMPDILASIGPEGVLNLTNSPFSRQFRTIEKLYGVGIRVKLNCAIFHDYIYSVTVLRSLLELEHVDIVLLPNLSNQKTFNYSWEIIEELLREFNFKEVGIRRRYHTSDTLLQYENETGKRVDVKTTKYDDFCFDALCKNCWNKNQCQEGFYGIRMEQRKGEPYVRLCLHRSDEDVLMPADRFLSSRTKDRLKEMWTYHEE